MSEKQEKHYIGHCPKCQYTLFADESQITNGTDWRKLYPGEARRVTKEQGGVIGVYAHCDQHGHKAFRLLEIKGTYNPNHKCNAQCRNAKRNECVCDCGGANHGRGYAATEVQARIPEAKPQLKPDHDWKTDPITANQLQTIGRMLDEREMTDEARATALERLPSLTKGQASAWFDKLKTLPRKS